MICSAASSMPQTDIEQHLDSPHNFCQSPSSISDVEFSLQRQDTTEKPSNSTSQMMTSPEIKTVSDAESGDEPTQPQDSMGALSPTSGSVDINEALAHPVSSSGSLKRKVQGAQDEGEQVTKKAKTEDESDTETVMSPASYVWTDDEEEGAVVKSVTRDDDGCAYDGYGTGYVESDATDVDCSKASSDRRSRRTLYIEYWSRTDECKERKWDHLDEIAENYGSAEEHIFATTLKGRTACLEPNMFPYATPAGIEHWTLWHIKDLNHEQVKQYVENWIDANAPHVERWNYDDNPERSIDIFHVHVYFQVPEGMTVQQGRKVEDLVHELD
ncbi:hypothetical protein BBO99_00000335 [Phytophthora kernoviae]|uniref:Uncharacterized protein n=2 Tax=Phytophthora kernoviae TaxID=325452 RepID=A0A421EZM1_9STRA|nr:hypothetical protein G195_000781 [Phytophthora kernoviae 00238/432]KAG2532863.1 hypothetical protein JM16_000093 [Phytophthora kernoviae]KAG2533587.1 hypothetical protein JM18_000095 [Phytophthora kernoviae]RLN11109.1 hypothetical protein BBI17_000126 [Phytophthora kernoviae]RLN86093.1 hypothetical protein BBO99_00000335 [Phytophthora kernoviae]